MFDLSDRIGDIARALLGNPNPKLSKRHQLRFGLRGSLAVEIVGEKAGSWFDHENGTGGGPWDLIREKSGKIDGEAVEWLRSIGIEIEPKADKRRIVAKYDYRGERGELLFQVVRFDPKDFRQRRPDGKGDWIWSIKGVRQVLYRLPELIDAPADARVYIAEGEKDVGSLVKTGLVATCNPGGAGKWRPDFARFLRGRHVVILSDNDDAGRDHAQAIAASLAPVAASAKIVDLALDQPSLPSKGDVSDWLAGGGTREKLERLADAAQPFRTGNLAQKTDPRDRLGLDYWLSLDIPPPDFLLGEILSTTSRAEIIAPSGLGKTSFAMALGMAIADGANFLHWRAGEGPRHVLFIDGEMSRRLMRRRLEDAVRRSGSRPDTFFLLNREEFPDLPPLNTEEGQDFVNGIIDSLGGVGLVIFDNVQALLVGDMKDEESWQQVLPWIRDLTRREIGQLWVHHTGHNEAHGYGTKTREWQLDTVMLMERIERPGADIAFSLSFSKARERSPENRADFEPAVITLADDAWTSERSTAPTKKARDRVLELLADTIERYGQIPEPSEDIPPGTRCVTEDLWRKECGLRCISQGSKESADKAFRRAAADLVNRGGVGKYAPWVWIVP
jgi:hypothetical protein